MKVLHLRRDRRFARVLQDILLEEGHQLHHADNWRGVFAQLPGGPYQLAVLALPRPTVTDEENSRHLSAAAGETMEIHLITGDKDIAARLQKTSPAIFKAAPPTMHPRHLVTMYRLGYAWRP